MPKNVGDLGKLIVAKCIEKLPKSKKSSDLVTLLFTQYKYVKAKTLKVDRCGGKMVKMQILYYGNPSSNPAVFIL